MARSPQSVRIIAGAYKGRLLRFPEHALCRPTMGVVRETLFHWLRPLIHPETLCLDPCSGSGALGFEAASQGVKKVVMFEAHRPLYQALVHNQTLLNAAERTEIILGRMPEDLKKLPENRQFDLVFLDPPFGTDLSAQICQALMEQKKLKPKAYLYLESPRQIQAQAKAQFLGYFLDRGWRVHREKCMGNVWYRLMVRDH